MEVTDGEEEVAGEVAFVRLEEVRTELGGEEVDVVVDRVTVLLGKEIDVEDSAAAG